MKRCVAAFSADGPLLVSISLWVTCKRNVLVTMAPRFAGDPGTSLSGWLCLAAARYAAFTSAGVALLPREGGLIAFPYALTHVYRMI